MEYSSVDGAAARLTGSDDSGTNLGEFCVTDDVFCRGRFSVSVTLENQCGLFAICFGPA